MRQKCKNCTYFGKSVTHVWYDCFTGEQKRDHYNNYCTFKFITIDKKRVNQYNKCPYHKL